jgi:tRNA pseudouridine55 synthase
MSELCGIMIVDKPVGVTSQVVIGRLRKVTGIRRIGHCGTLDPLASGVLPVMIGNATKACEYLMDHDNVYVASIRLGVETDTQDITGEVTYRHEGALPSFEEFAEVAGTFVGEIKQVPPMYSALKKDGVKLVNLAREGVTVEREARAVTIHSLETYEKDGEFFLKVHCSRGTYIRTLCADIGKKLGCGGCMASLRRTSVGQFDEKDSVPLDVLREFTPEQVEEKLIPIETLFSHYPEAKLPAFYAKLYAHGEKITITKFKLQGKVGDRFRVTTPEGRFTVGEISEYNGKLQLGAKMFF